MSGGRARVETFVCAVDGSDVSWCALRLALSLMRDRDTCLIVHGVEDEAVAGKDGTARLDSDSLLRNAQVEALKFRLRLESIHAEAIQLKEKSSLLQMLVSIANSRGKTFVVGASGRGHERKAREGAAKPLGSVAEQLLYHVKVPLILVRSSRGKFNLRAPDEIDPAHPRPEITFACAVDGSNISKRAFDRAISFALPSDTVLAVHCHDGLSPRVEPLHQLKNLKPFYDAETAKAKALKRAKECRFEGVLKKSGESNHAAIGEFCMANSVDLLVLGSIELADPTKGLYLGSVAAACAKLIDTNVCIVKNYC